MENRFGRRCFNPQCNHVDWWPTRKEVPLTLCPKCGLKLYGICGSPKRRCWASRCEHTDKTGFPNKTDICGVCGSERCKYKFTGSETECPDCGKPRWCLAPSKKGHACHRHGGNGPPKNMKYKGVPKEIVARFEAMQNDPDRLSTEWDINLFVTRQHTLMAQLYGGGVDGSLWAALNKQATELELTYNRLEETDDVVEANRLAEKRDSLAKLIVTLIGKGATEERRWKELLDITKDAARLKTEEVKRQKEQNATITVDEMLRMIVKVQQSIQQHVTDKDIRFRIGSDIERLVQLPNTVVDEPKE